MNFHSPYLRLGGAGFQSKAITTKQIFLDYSSFENPVIIITLPDGVDDITTKEWLLDNGYDYARADIIDTADNGKKTEISLDIKGRGNSSWGMDKKSYSIKLEKKNNLLNIAAGKHKNYALIANYADKTLLRNQLAYYMGREIFSNMEWNPHTKQVNLIINGTYRGLYMLTERIKINKNIVNIKDVGEFDDDDFSEGGWIVEVNQRLDETYNWISSHNTYFSLKDPDDYKGWKKILSYMEEVEDVIYGEKFKDKYNGWRSRLDEGSFIDWYLVNEIAKNCDAIWFSSVYMYYNSEDGLIHMGPLWDFDIGFGNINYNDCDSYEGFWIKDSGWYKRLFEDEEFESAVKNRWEEKKNDIFALLSEGTSEDITTIKEMSDALEDDAAVNFTLWQILGTYVWPNAQGYEERTTYQSEINYLSSWLNNRIEWLDENIALL